jgi:hypothetical protein
VEEEGEEMSRGWLCVYGTGVGYLCMETEKY